MKVTDVRIMNWEPLGNPPGTEWWRQRESAPDEPSIDAVLTMRLSLNEYQELLRKSEAAADMKRAVRERLGVKT